MGDHVEFSVFGINRLRMGIDGQGIRTLVGLYGCPLYCKYCPNPQSKSESIIPLRLSPQALVDRLKIDNLYFQATGGGVTFGGGEPLLQIDAMSEFYEIRPKAWNICAETSLYVPAETIKQAASIVDYFIVDIKSSDSKIYRSYTGGEAEIPLSNLELLASLVGKQRIAVRIPIIPGYADANDQEATLLCVKRLGIENIDLFTYIVK